MTLDRSPCPEEESEDSEDSLAERSGAPCGCGHGAPDAHSAYGSYDELTGLPDRRLFRRLLDETIERAGRGGYAFAVLTLDLDRFSNINHGLGYHVGDRMLEAVARRLEDSVPSGGLVARLWGDEFAVLLEGVSEPGEAVRVAGMLQASLKLPFLVDGRELYTTASIGIVVGSEGSDSAEDLLRDADTASRRASSLGGSRHEVFEPEMLASAALLLDTENELRQAQERGQLLVEYQPVVSLRSGRLSSFEALLRWRHPRRGVVPPEEFIPLAEDTGLIVPFGWFALREACGEMRSWRERFPAGRDLSVGVNLSFSQLLQPDLIQAVGRILRETGLAASGLRIEVTESVVARHPGLAVAAVERLRALGVMLHVDDFGTGYASLGMLHQLPAESLKINQAMVEAMSDAGGTEGIVRTIINLAHELGMSVVAEGVQTGEQLSRLRELGCDYGQGYLFSEPVAGEAAAAMIEAGPRW